MTTDAAVPGSMAAKLALLQAAAAWGDRLRPLLVVGSPADRLRDIAASEGGVALTEREDGLSIRFGAHVRWDVVLDDKDMVAGHSASGYGGLIDALGVDFAGRPHVPGDR